MTIAVSFERWANKYALRFAYNPDLVALVKTVPSSSRSWDPEARLWLVDAYHALRLAHHMRALGYLVTGLDPEPERRATAHNTTSGTDWARSLFRAVGPERSDAVFRSLTRILHPDNPATGDTTLQRELNTARAEMEKS